MSRLRIIITVGDPAGVGPEIVVKTLANWDIDAQPVVVGDRWLLEKAQKCCGVSISWQEVTPSSDFHNAKSDLPLLVSPQVLPESFSHWGKVSKEGGKASFEYLRKAVELIKDGQAQALVTAPLNKEALHAAAIPFIGHTEILKELTASRDVFTMFQIENLRVFFFTRHLPLIEAIQKITREGLLSFLKKMDAYLRRLGITNPCIAVAALNPHAGEGGLLGTEEQEIIAPAIEEAQKAGINAEGPFPADSIFFFAWQGSHDAVLSLYHDQGHIATKCINFFKTVSVTLGLPFIRTSPDHGTAYDIAWSGKANPQSMYEACRIAAHYATAYRPL
ncbi:4-hydroxythreonine-4-phosphate dehydrogenase PdxA [Thermatribacter velox]|uniref:4-hydroxythreonine-4-phosphate dehydrogenase PdxA n=1 Tax=Thermatribacter velox TaxID=3039681 RepID=A0ABZ2YB07_9BACT